MWLDRILHRFKIAPDVFIVGFQKCGTTSLYNWLMQQREFVPGKVKENNYLAYNMTSFRPGRYLADFPWRWQGARTADASHQNSFVPGALTLLAQTFPDARFVAIMRNPTERAYSHYRHNCRHGSESMPFVDRIEEELALFDDDAKLRSLPDIYAATRHFSAYGMYVAKGIYVNVFREAHALGIKLFPVCLERLGEDFEGEFKRIADYLEISDPVVPDDRIHNADASEKTAMPEAARARLSAFFEPYNRQLFELLGTTYSW